MARARPKCLVLACALCLLALGVGGAPSARACDAKTAESFGISPGCVDQRTASAPVVGNRAPDFTAAGGHPYQTTISAYLNAPDDAAAGPNFTPEMLKDLSVELPPGFAATPAAAATCTLRQLAESKGLFGDPDCPPASQVGVVELDTSFFLEGVSQLYGFPLYNLGSSPEVPARFGMTALNSTIVLEGGLRPDGGLAMTMRNVNQSVAPVGASIELWGVPSDPRHTPERGCPLEPAPSDGGPTCASGLPARPLLRLPTSCEAPYETTAEADSWEHPGAFFSAGVASHLSPGLRGDPTDPSGKDAPFPGLDTSQWGPPQALAGCDRLPFHPSLSVEPTSHEAGAPTGLGVEVSLPQQGFEEVEALSEADLRSARIAFPEGISVNASMANGLGACTAAQAALGSSAPATCPDSSKLGTVAMRSPMLAFPLAGAIYLAQDEDPGSTSVSLPAYVVAEGEGVRVKLAAQVSRNEASGRLEASFKDAPQVPLSSLRLSFFGGPKAPFLNPSSCGSYAFDASFTSWARPEAVSSSAGLQVTSGLGGGPCPTGAAPFTPKLSGGSASLAPRKPTSFAVGLSRPEGQQEITGLDVLLPKGISATLAGVPRCPEAAIAAASAAGRSGAAEAAAPSCLASSKLGAFSAQLGAGGEPFKLDTGSVYLAGPYEDAPFSLAVIAPALAGPLDLGTLVVRLPVDLDPRSGRVEISGRLPATQQGMRLGLRGLTLDIDRPGFIVNPSGCAKRSIDGTIDGDAGAKAKVSAPFRIAGCAKLGFKPALSMMIQGGEEAARHAAHPGLLARIAPRGGDAGIARAAITLPLAQQLDPARLGSVCPATALSPQSRCPALGSVSMRSPALAKPLRGELFMRSSKHRFPDLVAELGGEVDLELDARMSFAGGRVRIVFDSLPDVPLSRLSLAFDGGQRGILLNTRDLCASPALAAVELDAQNGREWQGAVPLRVGCG